MPIKKLVELDGEYGGWLEIDPVKLKRVATEFKHWLETECPRTDEFNIYKQNTPIVDAALAGEMKLPYKGFCPHNWELREGLLSRAYTLNRADFYNTIRGSLDAPPDVIMKDGRYFAWTEWEDPIV